jgi:hypothetical protein
LRRAATWCELSTASLLYSLYTIASHDEGLLLRQACLLQLLPTQRWRHNWRASFRRDGLQQELVPDHHPSWEVEAPYLTGPRQLEESLTISRPHAGQPFFSCRSQRSRPEAGSAGRKGVHNAASGDDDDHRQMRLRWRLHDGVGYVACFHLGQSSGEAILCQNREASMRPHEERRGELGPKNA